MRKFKFTFTFVLLIIPALTFGQLKGLTQLSNEVSESSGLAFDGAVLWTHNDSGNRDVLYGIDTNDGTITKKVFPPGTYNEDWEDLAIGDDGIVYISDTGNNDFSRKSVTIYGVIPDPNSPENVLTTTIEFPEDYTTKKGKIKYDVEALIYRNGSFYLFTKTFRNKFKDRTAVFEVAAKNGTQTARFCGFIPLCGKEDNCKITGAAFHQSSGQLALLSHKNVWLIPDFDPNALDSITLKRYEFDDESQKEGICFINADELLISEERNKGRQWLYSLKLRD
ncbi:hypothetical protein [Gilvibacter sediminis]|uniref:hypothetical protein n=1 Tax=Gilvibacter sediminis TaxID=379071 RepID=UPI00235031E6|nr:hypothetical protein [Gilvibacter sediminis]MDC7999109.1 hypothetical protein [Gilvibacter sediminis]